MLMFVCTEKRKQDPFGAGEERNLAFKKKLGLN